MEAASASPNLHLPCLQEIGSVEGNPFYCLCCLRTVCFCKALCAQTAAEQMMTMMIMMMMIMMVRMIATKSAVHDRCWTNSTPGSIVCQRRKDLLIMILKRRRLFGHHIMTRKDISCFGKTLQINQLSDVGSRDTCICHLYLSQVFVTSICHKYLSLVFVTSICH